MSNQNTDLGRDSIGKLMFKLSAPAIIAQIVNVLYNIVDRIFIGRMQGGDLAMAGVGVAFPIILIISAFSYLVGMGGAPLAAIKMGEDDNDSAEKIMGNSFLLLIVISIILTVGFLLFKEPILVAFGASEQTLGYGLDYISIYVLGTVFVQIALGMNAYINTQGFAKIGMMTVAIGALINIVLDPILIFKLNLGVKGAALATLTAQAVSAAWVLKFLFGNKSILKIRKKNLKLDKKIIISIVGLGMAPFIMQSTESLVLISLNTQLAKYGGDLAIGAMTIMSSIMQIITMPLMGLTQGAQPIISYNYGAKNPTRVKKAFKILLISCISYSVILWALAMITPETFVLIFNNDPELVNFTSRALRIYMSVSCVFGIQIACQQSFIALGNAKASLFLALLRKIILLIPLIYIMPMFISDKTTAVFMAEPVADLLAVSTTAILFFLQFRKAMKEISNPIVSQNEIKAY